MRRIFESPVEFWAFMAVLAVLGFIVLLLLAGCQMPLRTASAEYLAQRLVRIESDDARELEKFNHVDPALARFDAGNPGLILPRSHSLGDVFLAQFGVLPLLDEEPDQRTVVLGSDGLHSADIIGNI